MPRCQVKKGFLILSDCNAYTSHLCMQCHRPVCETHVAKQDGEHRLCMDCYGRKTKPADLDPTDGDGTPWRYAYRNSYYRNSRYSPVYSGSYYDNFYDDYDVRAFDADATESQDSEEWDDEAGADLFDS